MYLIGGIATPGESRAQAGEELITIDTTNWVCTRKYTTGAGPEFTDSHAAVIAGERVVSAAMPCWPLLAAPNNCALKVQMQVRDCIHLAAQMEATNSMR